MPSKDARNTVLTSQLIAECGLAVAAKTSVDEVSIRKIATELGVTPMAIYRHFSDKEALLAAMLDLFIVRADVLPVQTVNWQTWLHHVGTAMYQALCVAPSWIPLFGRLQLKPGALAVMDSYLATMHRAGFTREQAARGFFGLLQNLIGAATMRSAFSYMADIQNPLSELDPQAYPDVAAALPDIAKAMSDDLMQNGLRLLIDGLTLESGKASI